MLYADKPAEAKKPEDQKPAAPKPEAQKPAEKKPEEKKPPRPKDAAQKLCDQVAGTDQVAAYQARQALTGLCCAAGASGQDEARKKLAASLAVWLDEYEDKRDSRKQTTEESRRLGLARSWVLRTLSLIGGDAEVPAIKKCLNDMDCRESARWALERMHCQGAVDALAEVSQKAFGSEFRVGAINTLARKNGSQTSEALLACVKERDAEVRLAAAESLAAHADAANDKVIASCVAENAPGQGRRSKTRVARARIRLAENLAKAGQKGPARDVYNAVAQSDVPAAQKEAARIGIEKLG